MTSAFKLVSSSEKVNTHTLVPARLNRINRFAVNSLGLNLKDLFLGPMESYRSAESQRSESCNGERLYSEEGSFYVFELSPDNKCGATRSYVSSFFEFS